MPAYFGLEVSVEELPEKVSKLFTDEAADCGQVYADNTEELKMGRESEKALKAMHKFLEEKGSEDMTMDDVNDLLQKFTEEYNHNLPGKITEKTAKTPIFDSKRAEMPLFLGIIRSFDIAKM